MTNGLQTVNHKTDAVSVFKANIARQEREFRAALPAHIPVERFVRVLTTAVVNNPDLLKADRRSLFLAALRAAQDGLLPDGREGALVTFSGKVQWMPMVAGILKKVRNSGELLSIAAYVAYSNDDFSYELGDDEKICHRPALDDRGKPRLVYAIAKTKDGGIYREIMTVGDVERVRAVSRAANNGPWVSWWDEMARKTVLRRLSKRLPMSSDIDGLVHHDDYDIEGGRTDVGSIAHLADRTIAETPAGRLTADLDAIAAGGNGNGGGVYDPETGEIAPTTDETDISPGNYRPQSPAMFRTLNEDATGSDIAKALAEDAARQLAAKLEERIEERAQAADLDAGNKINSKLQSLLDAGRAAATNGKAKFRNWENNLNGPDSVRIQPHLDELRKAAAAADGGGA